MLVIKRKVKKRIYKIEASDYEITLIINLMIEIVDQIRDAIISAPSRDKRKDYISMRNTAMKLSSQFGIDLYSEELKNLKPVNRELEDLDDLYPINRDDVISNINSVSANIDVENKKETSEIECL